MSRSPPSRSPVPSVPDGRKREEASSCSSGQDQRREEDRRGRLEPQGTEGTVPSPLARKGFSLGNAGSAAVLAGNSPRRAPPDVEWRGVARCRMAERPEGRALASLGEPWRQPAGPGSRGRFRPPGEAGSINAAWAVAVRATRIERSRQAGPNVPAVPARFSSREQAATGSSPCICRTILRLSPCSLCSRKEKERRGRESSSAGGNQEGRRQERLSHCGNSGDSGDIVQSLGTK